MLSSIRLDALGGLMSTPPRIFGGTTAPLRESRYQDIWNAVDRLTLHNMLYVEGENPIHLQKATQQRRSRGSFPIDVAVIVRGGVVYFIRVIDERTAAIGSGNAVSR